FAHDLAHFVVGRMKGRHGAAATPLHGEGDDLSLPRIDQVTAVGVVVGRGRRGIQANRLLDPILASAYAPDPGADLAAHAQGPVLVAARDVLAIHIVMNEATRAVIRAVAEVHARIVRLVIVRTPAVQDGFAVAVQVDEIAGVREAIQQPDDVARFGL